MKKLKLVVALALLAVFALSAHPALAIHYGERCVITGGPGGSSAFQVCYNVNTRDASLGELAEGYMEWDHICCTGQVVTVRVDYVRLYWYNGGNPVILASMSGGVFDSRFEFRTSTPWVDTCEFPTPRKLYTQVRYRLEWARTGEPDFIGAYATRQSNQVRIKCGQVG